MAWLEQTETGRYHIAFRYGGLKFKRALRTSDKRAANARVQRVHENINLLEAGRLVLPSDGDVASFLLSDGQLNGTKSARPKRQLRTLGQFSSAFLGSIPDDALEQSTIKGMETHLRHLRSVMGASFVLPTTALVDIQKYIDERGKAPGIRGKKLSPATIKKELTTLRTMWNWAKDAGHLTGQLPLKGTRYPKSSEKPPFQTQAEIERRIARGGLGDEEQNELWSALFLTTTELAELLAHVQAIASHDFLYPMFVFAAHTGARRSEMLRSQLDDINFEIGTVTIREKKRVRGQLTTRSVPLSPLLRQVLREYLPNHPGGQFTFSLPPGVARSKNKATTAMPLSCDQAHDHFKRAVAGSNWSKARGWHVFRHSFCSNCAAAGIDQRIINGWVGHQTEAMVKRYRHLIPDQQQKAIAEVFPE
ncbi:tyrosine-type recombinase/integrase [Adhaeretor mobilis]|uniref:Site-specific tyrosine recombinase XerC n=1 Tax=Adhaeretor mobilis TaxID=1930276 RepID=A0A517MZV8_9BACT|nr:site-specific integrase [Adhaeretor mobilis]QDT00419.1 site-specific tyrosine recombinase XerC [Adhaeretor mobilis]